MLKPAWHGIIDPRKGLYYSNSKNKPSKNDTTTNDTTTNDTTTNDTTTNIFIDKNIPYYNENLEYLRNNINNEKYNANYFNLLDRIGYISRYLLKGNDYYRLYISKNANKYFTNDDSFDVDTNTNTNTNTNNSNNSNNSNTNNNK